MDCGVRDSETGYGIRRGPVQERIFGMGETEILHSFSGFERIQKRAHCVLTSAAARSPSGIVGPSSFFPNLWMCT